MRSDLRTMLAPQHEGKSPFLVLRRERSDRLDGLRTRRSCFETLAVMVRCPTSPSRRAPKGALLRMRSGPRTMLAPQHEGKSPFLVLRRERSDRLEGRS